MTSSAPRPTTLSRLVDASRLDTGELDGTAEALTDGRTSYTWSTYVERVARTAGVLLSAGVGPGDRVGIRLSKSVESFVAVHAVLRAGAVVVPVDPQAPTDHAASVLTDAGVEILVTDAKQRAIDELAAASTVRLAIVPTRDATTENGPADVATIQRADIDAAPAAPRVDVPGDAPAYIIYTSGSTGRPKGIVHSHHSALAYATQAAATYDLTPSDRLANIAPLHFDQSTFELYAAPLAGAGVIVVPEPVLRFPASLSELIEAQRATVWYSVPYLLDQLSTRGALDQRDLSSLRWVLFGGEEFPPAALADLMRQLPGARFSNVYGPAEVNQCMVFNLSDPPDATDDAVPIGRAWPGARLQVVELGDLDDPTDDPTPVAPGEPGVLLVQSDTMMTGYWNRPDLTAASTIESRRSDGSRERWYVTGDLVVERPDGNLEFLGRRDNQIKLRGHRIELEAIDAVLRDTDGVRAATVVVDRPAGDEDRLVALVVPDGRVTETEPLLADVAAELRRRLPRYALPGDVIAVVDLPRTSTGKVDRGASKGLLDA